MALASLCPYRDPVIILRPRAPGQAGSFPRVGTCLFLFWKVSKSALPVAFIPGSPASLWILEWVGRALGWISWLRWFHPLPPPSLATIWVCTVCQALCGSLGLLISFNSHHGEEGRCVVTPIMSIRWCEDRNSLKTNPSNKRPTNTLSCRGAPAPTHCSHFEWQTDPCLPSGEFSCGHSLWTTCSH